MRVEKLVEVLKFYDEYLQVLGVCASRLSKEDYSIPSLEDVVVRRHLRWMIRECLGVLETETPLALSSLMKSMRWLGYIQGELRAMGEFTLLELRGHSREREPEEDVGSLAPPERVEVGGGG